MNVLHGNRVLALVVQVKLHSSAFDAEEWERGLVVQAITLVECLVRGEDALSEVWPLQRKLGAAWRQETSRTSAAAASFVLSATEHFCYAENPNTKVSGRPASYFEAKADFYLGEAERALSPYASDLPLFRAAAQDRPFWWGAWDSDHEERALQLVATTVAAENHHSLPAALEAAKRILSGGLRRAEDLPRKWWAQGARRLAAAM